MFTQPCFIRKNTKEIIEKLEELGYDYAENGAGAWFIPLCQLEYIGVNLYSKGYYMGVNGVWSNDWYDCGTNERLFIALASLRDDSDNNQWFVMKIKAVGGNALLTALNKTLKNLTKIWIGLINIFTKQHRKNWLNILKIDNYGRL